jgi:hypothetical protein
VKLIGLSDVFVGCAVVVLGDLSDLLHSQKLVEWCLVYYFYELQLFLRFFPAVLDWPV